MKLRTYQASKKIESREEKGSIKIWELDSENSDVYSDSFVESDTDESSNSLGSIGILYYPCTFAPPRFRLFVFVAQIL